MRVFFLFYIKDVIEVYESEVRNESGKFKILVPTFNYILKV